MSTRARTKWVALSAAAIVTLAMAPSARADHHHPVIPTQQEVDDAQQQVADARRSVSDIQADLAAANRQLEDLAVAAEQASEAYNGAVVAWTDARSAAKAARLRADQASSHAATARDTMAGYVVAQDSSAPGLSSLSTTLTSDGSHTLLSQLADADTSSHALDSHYQSWSAASELAVVYQAAAKDALGAAQDAKAAAAQAKQTAKAAVSAQQDAVVSIGAQRTQLIHELAKSQDISLELAASRQTGLEQRRQARQAERRRRAMLREQRQERRQQHQHHGGNNTPPSPTPQPNPQPDPPPRPDPPPNPSGNAQDAIDFAYAQLGEPYQWGATGPDSWDCSGLTMGAWANAGVYLPHYSVDQYLATTAISYSQLQPGDLIFWASDSSNPATIFHVALYIGGGQMIHAPHTGENVQVQDVLYWETPDFFGRP